MKLIEPFQVKLEHGKRELFKKIAEQNKDNPSELVRKWIDKYIDENKK